MVYLQNLNDKDYNAIQMQYCQYQYLINKDNAVEMQLICSRKAVYEIFCHCKEKKESFCSRFSVDN
jgi:hypothetical protein